MTELAPLELVQRTLGGTITKKKTPLPSGKFCWCWKIHCLKAKHVAEALLPYLVLKKPRAALLIEFQDHTASCRRRGSQLLSIEELALREEMRQRMLAFNV